MWTNFHFIIPFGHILLFLEARNIHQSNINMIFVWLLILDNLFLKYILNVIMEGTFAEATT